MMMERRALAQALRRADPFFLIAGPCVLESERVVMAVAARCVHSQCERMHAVGLKLMVFVGVGRLAEIREALGIPVIFKASFDKANRQDLDRFVRWVASSEACPSL